MNAEEKLRNALQAFINAEESIKSATAAVVVAKNAEASARTEAMRLLKLSGKKKVLYKDRMWYILDEFPERLSWDKFDGIVL